MSNCVIGTLENYIRSHSEPISCFADNSTIQNPILSDTGHFAEFRQIAQQEVNEINVKILNRFSMDELRAYGIPDQNDIERPHVSVVKGFNQITGSWHCIVCGESMGVGNPRQFCRKSYCPLNE